MGAAFADDRKERTWGAMLDYQLNIWSKHALAVEGGYSLDRYTTTDIGLEKNLENKMTFGFFVDNIFGMNYQPVYGFQAPGRTYGVRLQLNSVKTPFTR